MTQFLPPNLLALFAPRDPIPFLPQLEKLPHEKHHNQPYCGIAPFIRHFEDPRDAPPPTRAETREERLERKRREKIERRQTVLETELKLWDPHNDSNAQGDAFKTLFVARINYDTTESKLRREFEVYGPIKRIYIVYNKRTGKPRGYAFIEYEHERDMHCIGSDLWAQRLPSASSAIPAGTRLDRAGSPSLALRTGSPSTPLQGSDEAADAQLDSISTRPAMVHRQSVMAIGQSWLADDDGYDTSTPYYHSSVYGGGLGGTRRGGADVNIKHSGRDDASRYDDRSLGGDRGERRERSRDRDRDKDRERRRTRSRERRRHTRSRERERERERGVVAAEDGGGSSRRRERDRERGATGGDSRSRERSRDRKRRSRSRDRKRDRERGKGLDGEEVSQGDGATEAGERVQEEHEGGAPDGTEERKDRDRDRDRDRRRSHRDRDRRRERDRDREHKRERGDRDRERREDRHGSTRDDTGPQDNVANEEEGPPANMEEYSQDGMMDQQSFQSAEDYASGENGFKMEGQADEY
ncbi:PREDICTED: U1 small nuclear ribonucleoprotein 70 kDa [Cyprinodon variegatus]|uniref:U1 small nuclear ribonucleoprotein 70 kDa n=1 Tax=Cyprinodon variegatus TaxID=28743 RepID=UPI000742935D|nr:PREDICTED: U1 small nuclear ribonucleoprotein 70 kDa [Cyprinodon variegatus]